MAEEPVAGQVKTGLCPPCSAAEAAAVAEAALADTLEAVAGTKADRRVVALAGERGSWLPGGFEVIAQRGERHHERLNGAWAEVGGPGLQIGMDTPQASSRLLDDALDTLASGAEAVVGRTVDGGWWGIGFQSPPAGVFDDRSTNGRPTADEQIERCRGLGLEVVELATLRDVDSWDDALAVAGEAPATRFAAAVRSITSAGVEGKHR